MRSVVVPVLLVVLVACGDGYRLGVAPGPGPAPADAGPAAPAPDAGPLDDGCRLQPPSDADSLAEFVEVDLLTAYGCAGCHGGGAPTAVGSGAGWGPGSAAPAAADWHGAALAQEATQVDVAIRDTRLYLYFGNFDATHATPHPASQAAVEAWLTYRRTFRVCGSSDAGTAGDAGVVVDAGQAGDASLAGDAGVPADAGGPDDGGGDDSGSSDAGGA